jgi:hypothetical protein
MARQLLANRVERLDERKGILFRHKLADEKDYGIGPVNSKPLPDTFPVA